MQEEMLKQDLLNVLTHYNNNEGLSIGAEFYILKDVFNEFSKVYKNYLDKQMTKLKEKESKEFNESLEESEVEE